jgi:hypothetical protein
MFSYIVIPTKPGPIKFFPGKQRRPLDSIQGVPAFAGMTGVELWIAVKTSKTVIRAT